MDTPTWIVLGFIMLTALFVLKEYRGGDTSNDFYPTSNDYADLDASKVTLIDLGHGAVRMDYEGRHFNVWKDAAGGTCMQEVDRRGVPIGAVVSGPENAWKFGSTPDKTLAKGLKYKINKKVR